VIVEVTSDSTEYYDHGKKLTHYKQIPSLEAVVIVSHRESRVDVWSRSNDSPLWSRTSAAAGACAAVPTLGCLLDVDAIWRATAEPA
jgi:Uma2 family endonuclease